ncbi:unnamed protein product [Blumeria hordei]|uniref:Enoyl reductase (ER) domain-containing protein n=1 Tax=Blumeria hordei TaxID=2867405 RepID=A0A383UVK9_BLUHO|nr:unnamed protein product [Blumeria hordei]
MTSRSTYSTVVLAERPKGQIIPGQTFKIVEKPMLKSEDIPDGHLLVETLYLSLDPAMRGWLSDTRSYVPPVGLNEVMRGYGIARVINSPASNFKLGDYVACSPGWTEMAILPESAVVSINKPPKARLTDALGVLGLTGLTAYFGITEIGKVKAGDFVVVSGAAGATGSVVCQIAKIKGARVLGIAGSEEKVKWLKELGCDAALNYKAVDFQKSFMEETKDLIDIYYDNVGGDLLEMALTQAKPHARFVMCGAISQYNSTNSVGPRNLFMVIAMRIRMQGFIVTDFAKQFDAAREELGQWLTEGKLQRRETVITGGLKMAEHALCDLFRGVNTGKLLVEVKNDNSSYATRI